MIPYFHNQKWQFGRAKYIPSLFTPYRTKKQQKYATFQTFTCNRETSHEAPRHHAPRRNRQAITRNFYFAIFRKIILIFQRKSLPENNLLNSYLRNSLFNVITSKNELIKQEIYWARNSSVTFTRAIIELLTYSALSRIFTRLIQNRCI